ncbi:MAG TPA: PDZ domain-containing protein, partial [Candidatus Manganitrophaceae bacterium]|nr:PDZ domain-containing protein [Candidatus Manganitrophaceae bacterium]
TDGSPAGAAGLQSSDLIVSMNGQTVMNVDDLHRLLSEWPIGRRVTLTIIRGTERMELEVVPVEASESTG